MPVGHLFTGGHHPRERHRIARPRGRLWTGTLSRGRSTGVFTGRARRKEFWIFSLGNLILYVALGFFSEGVPEETITKVVVLCYLVLFLPSLAVGVRRMHDSNHSGWWVIVPLVSWMFWCVDGTRGPNRFGDDPKSTRI